MYTEEKCVFEVGVYICMFDLKCMCV